MNSQVRRILAVRVEVIIGHRRQTFLERWWSSLPGSSIMDNVQCSVMIARETISDAQFEAHFQAAPAAG